MDSKAEIRAIVKDKLSKLDEKSQVKMANKIRQNIFKLERYVNAKTVFSYVSKDREVDTIELIINSLNMGKIVGVPLIKSNKELEIKKISDMNQLKIGKYGILEPPQDLETINPKDLEILFIPGLAFGINYERLGRGGGYFDIFLAKTSGIKVGLAYEFQLFNSLPSQEHDIKMDIIVTEKRIIRRV